MKTWIYIAVIMCSGISIGQAEDLRFTSGPARVSLLELYTSEGCSSCPPAEQWLGARRDDPYLWKRFVPISFHVTYWDHLGWKDVMAQPSFTARQRAYAATWRNNSVYTPCFVRNGAEWHPGEAEKTKDAAAGELTVQKLPSGDWELSFVPSKTSGGDFDGYVALLGQGISTKIRAGENKGGTPTHDFVALDLSQAALAKRATDGAYSAIFQVKNTVVSPSSLALAAWVTARGKLDPLQATGGEIGK